MRKLLILMGVALFATMLHAQEKGLYLFGGGQAGLTRFNYILQKGTAPGAIGYGGGIGIQYFFTYNIGLSIGLNYQKFTTKSVYANQLFEFPNQIDNEGDINTLRINLLNWTEKQKTSFIDIPLMIALQKKFGDKEAIGFYFSGGVKLQIPVKSTHERTSGDVNLSAYYHEDALPLGDGQNSVELPQHNLGTNNSRFWSGKNQLKTGLALTGEAGFLFGLSRRVDLRIGVTADYGLFNIQKEKKEILKPVGIQQEGSFIADKVNYAGVLNSNQIKNGIHPLSIQGYLGLRIKLGALKDLAAQNEEKYGRFEDSHRHDTLYVIVQKDTIIVQFPENYFAEKPNAASKQEESAKPNLIPHWYIFDENDNPEDSLSIRKAKAKVETIVAQMEGSIYFDLGKYDLKPESIKVLDQKIALMKKYPAMQLSLVAHTCDLGNDKLNDQLSENRAEMARFYMISRGISSQRITDVPMGKKFPTYPNTSEYNRSRNRSVNFVVVE